jgi:DNA replication protein DnaC
MHLKNSPFKGNLKEANLRMVLHTQEVCDKLLEWTRDPKNMLFFSGGVGTGKSYYASALFNQLENSSIPVCFYNEIKLFDDLRVLIDNPHHSPFKQILSISDSLFLIIEDFGSTVCFSSKEYEWKKELLFMLIDLRWQSDLPTLITSSLSREELDLVFDERLVSRIYAAKNTVVEVNEGDRRRVLNFGKAPIEFKAFV